MGMPQKLERYRFRVLRHTLSQLKLQPGPENVPRPPLSPLPQFLVTTPTLHNGRPTILFAHPPPREVSGGEEFFEFRPLAGLTLANWAVIRQRAAHGQAGGDHRILVICPGELPHQPSYTPYFDLTHYFELLGAARGPRLPSNLLGNKVLYGEAVTSTQTQLTK